MKRSQMKTILLIEGAVCLTLTLALRLIEGAAFSFAAFPGSAAGQGLSMLAGTGRFGFALALTLYAFLVLLPLYALARIRVRRDWKAEDTLLAAATAYFAIGLLDTMEDGAFTQESAAYAPKLAEWCVKVLKISVLFALAVNILQAVCAPLILSTSISIRLPVLELCFVLAALLGARLIASNVALAADNDLFI